MSVPLHEKLIDVAFGNGYRSSVMPGSQHRHQNVPQRIVNRARGEGERQLELRSRGTALSAAPELAHHVLDAIRQTFAAQSHGRK